MRKLTCLKYPLFWILILSMLFCVPACGKKELDELQFSDLTVSYDGTAKSISVSGAPDGATVTYSPTNTYIEIGEYTVTATVAADGYETKELTATLRIVAPENESSQEDIKEALMQALQETEELLRADIDARIASLDAEYEAELKKLTDSQTATAQEIAQLNKNYDEKIAALKADFDQKLAAIEELESFDADTSEKLTALEEQILDLTHALVASGSLKILDNAYTVRETAEGGNVLEGSSTTVKRITGSTVCLDGVLRSASFEKIVSKDQNLFAPIYRTATSNGITYTVNSDTSVTVTGTATNKSYFALGSFTSETLPAGTYTVSGGVSSVEYLISGYNGSAWAKQLLHGDGAFTVDYNGYDRVVINLYVYTGMTANKTVKPMLNSGGKAQPWSPYRESTLTLPSKAQLAAYDYIDVSQKKLVQQSALLTFTGNEGWTAVGSLNDGTLRFGLRAAPSATALSGICNLYPMGKGTSAYLSEGYGAIIYANGFLEVINRDITSLDAWKAYLKQQNDQGTPLMILYQTAEPQVTDLNIANGYEVYRGGLEMICGNDGAKYGALCSVTQYYQIENAPTLESTNKRPPVITFIDDDGTPEAFINWELIGDAAGIRNTFALVTSRSDMSWDEVERLQGKGFEFISHSHTHPRLNDLSEEQLIEEFKTTTKILREHGCESRFIVYPYNSCNAETLSVVKRYFMAGILGADKTNIPPINTYALTRHSVLSNYKIEKEVYGEIKQVVALKSMEEFQAIIDDAIENGGWVIFMSHFFTNDDSGYYCDAEVRQLIVDVCQYATENGAEVLPFGEAFDLYKNRLTVGSMSDDSYCIVDCDGVVYEK